MGGEKTQLDLERLRYEIRHLSIRKDLYRVLKEELSKIGHWRQLPRGNPAKGFSMRGQTKHEDL